ncbi:MAG: MATE family efflux transporter [Chloroflexota bacterium]
MRGTGGLRGRGASSRRDWTQGSIPGNLWALYWPMLVTNALTTLGPFIDLYWVGKLGAASIAGVGVSGIAVMVVNSLLTGLFQGTSAMCSRAVGAGDERTANRVAQQAFVVGIAYSIILAIIGIFLAEQILTVLGLEREVVEQGAAYMRIQFVGMVTMGSLMLAQSVMYASGDSRTPMKINLGYRIFHMTLVPFLVFGWWIFPTLGVRGAALSNVIAQALGGGIALWFLFSGRTRLRVTLKNFRFDGNIIWRTVRIGIPASITQVERSFSDLVLVRFIIPFGTFAVAAHTIAQRIDQLVQMPCGGIGTAAGILAGQNLGAGKPERAARGGWIAAGLATCWTVAASILIWLGVERLIIFYANGNTNVVELASAFLKIQIFGYVLWGGVIALSMCLNGVGDTRITMLTNLTSMWGVAITLAFVLSRYTDLGIYGIRWAMVIGITARAIIYGIYFKSGRWQHKKV